MTKKIFNKTISALLFVLLSANTLIFAQTPPKNVPEPEIQSDAFGAQASSIDMYTYILIIMAIGFAVYFSKKYTKQNCK